MYFLAKFCRICVQTEENMLDLDTIDFDKIKLSEKLEACTKTVVTRESLSTEICFDCLAKLRVSYEFIDMCKKSSKKIQGYFRAIISKNNEKINEENFVNTELNVFVTPLREYENYEPVQHESQSQREKRKRITKEQRCSLLKKLLTNHKKQSKERDKRYYQPLQDYGCKGGLRNIINFTRNYEFGLKLDKNCNIESTPLDKLKAFSTEYFRRDFTDFRNTILYIIENKDNVCESGESEDEYFDEPVQEIKEEYVKSEEVIVEPDLRIKTEPEEDTENYDYYNDIKTGFKKEVEDDVEESTSSSSSFLTVDIESSFHSFNSMQNLNNFVGNYAHKRTFSPHNARCRTRDNPYINPLLKEQFLYRSFKCQKCSRYFKSPGYLKAHYSKVH